MKMLGLKNILKDYYKVQPSEAVMISSVSMMAFSLRIFMGIIIDSKVLPKRKYYLVFFGLMAAITQFVISMYWIKSVYVLCMFLFAK